MSTETTEAKTEHRCDRCSAVYDPTKKCNMQNLTKFQEVSVKRPWYRAIAVWYPRDGGARVLEARVDLCDYCQWEFDVLFLQGRPVPWHPNRKEHSFPENPETALGVSHD